MAGDRAIYIIGRASSVTVDALADPAKLTRDHNHVRAIEYLRSRGHFAEDGQLHNLRVLHDDWCALLARRGPCNCHPQIRLDGVLQAVPAWVYRRENRRSTR